MYKRPTKSDYETHNREIINNNFPERMNVLIPCTCGKTFKAQDGHFRINKKKYLSNALGVKGYLGFDWRCREQKYQSQKEYAKNHPEKIKKVANLKLKGNKNSLNRTLRKAVRKHITKSECETHNREIINNNFPERMDVLIPCSCGKTFKAQDGHFRINKNKSYTNSLGIKYYLGFSWVCRERERRRNMEYDTIHIEQKKERRRSKLKGNKNALKKTVIQAIITHRKRFPDEPCIFKNGGRFRSSPVWEEAWNHNKQVIKNFLEQQNYKCALTGDPINELTASIDRIDSNHGYIEGNIQLTIWRANVMKNNLQSDEFIDLCTKVYLHTQRKKSNSESSQDLGLQSTCIPRSLESSEILEE